MKRKFHRSNVRPVFKTITDRLRLVYDLLTYKFSHKAEEDLDRAEEQHRGRNQTRPSST